MLAYTTFWSCIIYTSLEMIGIEEVGMDAVISLCIYTSFTRHYLFNSTDMDLKLKKIS